VEKERNPMKKICRQRFVIAFIALVILSLACSSQVTIYKTPSPPNVETVVAATLAVFTQNAPKATATNVPTATSVPASPTAEAFGEVYVYTVVDNVNLRTQPGMFFQVSRVMPKDTKLKLLGRAPGGEWLSVVNDDGVAGWVNENVVMTSYDGPPAPVVEPTDVLLVTGKVETELGTPVSGIGFAVIQGTRRIDVMTDETGTFYAYLPLTMSGSWTVGYVSVSCKSNTMNASCNCISAICGAASPVNSAVTLPQRKPLQFVWK
jgi:hypothetical protein